MRRHEAIEDQALDWLIRRDAPDWSRDEQVALQVWLDDSPAHKAAFWRADHLWRQADRIRSLGYEPGDRSGEHEASRTWRPMAIAAGMLAAICLGALSVTSNYFDRAMPEIQQARFETPVGGRRVVPLVDGSNVELNTQTVLRTEMGKRKREVWLDVGEAFFEVAHRENEPFVVHAGRHTITVLGTKFSVRRDMNRVTVNVLEGRVRVDDGPGPTAHAAIITAGDTAISRGESTLITAKSDDRVADALAWRDGKLTFDQAPLTQVVAEFNRYNRVQLVVTDAAAGDIPIGGSFVAGSVESFTRLLHDAYGLKIERADGVVKISGK